MKIFEHSLEAPNLYDKELDQLIQSVSSSMELKPNEIFSSPYMNSTSMFYIKSGKTKHYLYTSNGAVKVLFFLSPGWIWGETTYFLSQETGVYSQAYTDCLLYKFDTAICHKLLRESSLFRDKLLECLSRKTFLYRTEVENLTFYSAKDRLKAFFCSVADPSATVDGNWLQLKVSCTHSELGEIIGTTRVTISRIISDLSRENFCRIMNHNIQLNKNDYLHFVEEQRDT